MNEHAFEAGHSFSPSRGRVISDGKLQLKQRFLILAFSQIRVLAGRTTRGSVVGLYDTVRK